MVGKCNVTLMFARRSYQLRTYKLDNNKSESFHEMPRPAAILFSLCARRAWRRRRQRSRWTVAQPSVFRTTFEKLRLALFLIYSDRTDRTISIDKSLDYKCTFWRAAGRRSAESSDIASNGRNKGGFFSYQPKRNSGNPGPVFARCAVFGTQFWAVPTVLHGFSCHPCPPTGTLQSLMIKVRILFLTPRPPLYYLNIIVAQGVVCRMCRKVIPCDPGCVIRSCTSLSHPIRHHGPHVDCTIRGF